MSQYTVPCHAPYAASPISPGDPTVVLKVGRIHRMEEFTVPVGLLCNGSEYFRRRLRDYDAEMIRRPFEFPRDSPQLFDIFVDFLKHGTILHPNLFEASIVPSYRLLADLFTFTNDFKSLSLRNATLDASFLCVRHAKAIPYKDIRYIYDKTEDNSSLRDLIVTMTVNVGSKRRVKDCEDGLPKAFLMDCLSVASEDGVVPFAADKEEWMEGKREKMCKHYHVHEDDSPEEEEEENMELDSDSVQGGQLASPIREMRKLRVRY